MQLSLARILTLLPDHRQLSKLAQAFSSAGIYYYPLLSSIVKAAELKLPEFDPASLSNLMKCLSRLNYPVGSAFSTWLSWRAGARVRLKPSLPGIHHQSRE